MSIYMLDGDEIVKAMNEDAFERDTCFKCGKSLFNSEFSTGGIIIWKGYTDLLTLHQHCAQELGVNLIQDVRSLESRIGIKIVSGNTIKIKKDIKYVWHYKEYHGIER